MNENFKISPHCTRNSSLHHVTMGYINYCHQVSLTLLGFYIYTYTSTHTFMYIDTHNYFSCHTLILAFITLGYLSVIFLNGASEFHISKSVLYMHSHIKCKPLLLFSMSCPSYLISHWFFPKDSMLADYFFVSGGKRCIFMLELLLLTYIVF